MAVLLSSISQPPASPEVPTGIIVALGSNLGYKNFTSRQLIDRALVILEEGGDKVVEISSMWQSHAWPANTGASDYINAVSRIATFDNNPAALLSRLHTIEAELGRVRDPSNQWASRTIDIDLLDYNGIVANNDSFLTLPHPRIAVRDFVLLPLIEIAPKWVHPITGLSAVNLLENLNNASGLSGCWRLEPNEEA